MWTNLHLPPPPILPLPVILTRKSCASLAAAQHLPSCLLKPPLPAGWEVGRGVRSIQQSGRNCVSVFSRYQNLNTFDVQSL